MDYVQVLHQFTFAASTENNPEPLRCGYKETFVQEYDGIKVYHHQGSYQHIGPQVYTWAFYESDDYQLRVLEHYNR